MKNKGYFGGASRPDRKTSKKIIIIAVVVAAIFIPAIAAWINYSVKSQNPDDLPDNLMKVSLYDGDVLLYEEEEAPERAASNTLVSIFDSVLKNKTDAPNATDLSQRKYLRVVITTTDNSDEYKCYFSEDDENSYCVDSSNKLYLISNVDAHAFMISDYSETLYEHSAPPKLFTTAGNAVVPISVNWKYKDSVGNVKSAVKSEIAEPELMYDMAGALGISFDTEPDECTVKLYKSGIIIYTGLYTEMADITVEPGTTLRLKVDATWKERADTNCFGTVSYDFKVLLRDRSEFILSKTELTTGDFITVACTNVLDTSKITFKSEPDIGFTPRFFEDGDIVRALIPFKDSLPEGKYSLSFVYGAAHETIDITLTSHKKSEMPYTVKDEALSEFESRIGADSLAELAQIISETDTSHINYIFFRNSFDEYSQLGGIKTYKYGDVFASSDAETAHSVQGEFWTMSSAGASVTALNGGYVASVGKCGYLGSFVVIEHGMGLRTVYGHLNNVAVSAGDYVTKGELIGHTGSLSNLSPEGVFIQCYIFNVAVDIDNIAGKKIELYTIPDEATNANTKD